MFLRFTKNACHICFVLCARNYKIHVLSESMKIHIQMTYRSNYSYTKSSLDSMSPSFQFVPTLNIKDC